MVCWHPQNDSRLIQHEMLLGLLIFLVASIVLFVVLHLRPLTEDELHMLAVKRRRRAVRSYFVFSPHPAGVNGEFKSRMNATGRLYDIDVPLYDFPAVAAGLLKYKKHEWIVVAMERDRRVFLIWLNKGYDNSSVGCGLHSTEIREIARRRQASSILVFHNHPNPNPARYSCTKPSSADIAHAASWSEVFYEGGLNHLDFVCERGHHYEYHRCPAEQFMPVSGFLERANRENGVSWVRNLKMHASRFFG